MAGKGKRSPHKSEQKTAQPRGLASLTHDSLISSPQTAEDFVLLALEKGNLSEVVEILRDWYGAKQIRRALNRLHHRDPVDRFKHARRNAVELYARMHKLTPANLMVQLTGVKGRGDAEGSERYKLRKAREYLAQDAGARVGAEALAHHWEKNRPIRRDPVQHIKSISPEI